jgi:hypothetical protein
MRILLIVAILGAALWGCYWFLGAQAVTLGAQSLLDDLDADPGLSMRRTEVSVGGFPFHFELTVGAPELRILDGGLGWAAPEFRLTAPSYRPTHITAILPRTQTLTLGGEPLAVTSTEMRATLSLRPRTTLPVERVLVSLSELSVAGGGGRLEVGAGWLATNRADEDGRAHDLGVDISSILPDGGWLADLPVGTPSVVEGIVIDARLDFGAPLALAGPVEDEPQLTRVELRDASVEWGPMALSLSGSFEAGRAGLWSGRASLTMRGWEQMLDIAIAARWVEEGPANFLRGGLRALEQDGSVTVPIDLREGALRVAGIPIGRPPASGGF